jgi:hypothetical protein
VPAPPRCAHRWRETTDRPDRLGALLGPLAGGYYLRGRLTGAPDEIYRLIGDGMSELQAVAAADDTRPLVEFYRRHKQIELRIPIRA